MTRITASSYDLVDEIAWHLRDDDYRELRATSCYADPRPTLAQRVMSVSSMTFCAIHQGAPVACWGLIPMWPGVGMAYAFGTDAWDRVLLPMTKHVKRFMLPLLLDSGYHRIECRSLASRQDTKRWLRLFGAREEAVMRSSGVRGEDFKLYRWLRDEHHGRPPIESMASH